MSCAKLPGTLKGGCSLKRPFEKEAGESKGDGTPPLPGPHRPAEPAEDRIAAGFLAFRLGSKCEAIRCCKSDVGVRPGAVK